MRKIQILYSLLLVPFMACQESFDFERVSLPEEETLQVSLVMDFAPEEDGYSASFGNGTRAEKILEGEGSFDVKQVPKAVTRADVLLPGSLYNLEIRQYSSSGAYLNGKSLGTIAIGSKVIVPLTVSDDCQLVVVVRGNGNTVAELGTRSLSAVQTSITANAATIESINPSGDMNSMPYFLHLPHVKVVDAGSGNGTIQSTESGTNDVRLLLKRLASRVTLNWTLSTAMQQQGYELKEVKLCQIPKVYYLFPSTESTEWGTTYPTTVSEFVDTYRLTGADLSAANGSKTVWIPANVRGNSIAATSPIHRTRENAPTAASYAELVVDNATRNERLYYRAYLGGKEPTDFNLKENTDYNWTLNITSADYTSDSRIQLLDQTPVESSNLVPTANCLMLAPGGNLSFNPYQHTSGTGGWNDYLVNNPGTSPSVKSAIASVKVLWQTKDAGTSGDLVLGYVINDTNHKNLVNITNPGDVKNARVSVKAPVTEGGNAVIAAYAADGTTILWSWHIWVTDYSPIGLQGTINEGTRANAISAARTATRNGAVQVYQGISWTDPTGTFYKCVIMDRHLGATRTGMQNNMVDGVRTFGLLYQGGRKDPFFSTADGTTEEKKTIFDGYGMQTQIDRANLGSLDALVRNPKTFSTSFSAYDASGNWNGDRAKTIHDPCPNGWRVPSNEVTPNNMQAGGLTDNTTKYCMMAGFGSTNTSLVYESTPPAFNNVMYYNGTGIVAINKTNPVEASTFVGSGFIYYGTNAGPGGDTSIFFPGVSLREYNTGNYRSSVSNNSMFLWSSTREVQYNAAAMKIYQIQGNQLSHRHTISWTYGFSVRCVQDNIQAK